MESRFSTYVVGRDAPDGKPHPNPEHNERLMLMRSRLGYRHHMAYCTGCTWVLRYPSREHERLVLVARQHMLSAHFTALVDGRACVDEFGDAEFMRRMRMVH